MTALPQIVRVDGRPRLLVDGQPFLILGIQWACESCFSLEVMIAPFHHAARMATNTAVIPVYWREVEPEPGRFDFTLLDERIQQCRAHGLRLIPLWFATWKNAHAFYAPDYIQGNPRDYPPAVDREGKALVSLCPSGEATWARDCRALRALVEHLRAIDDQHTVIMLQLENEPGMMGSDRCYCLTCSAKFQAEDWEARYGADAAEAFSVVSIASYIDRLAAAAKEVYPLPMYMNVWLASLTSMPGRNYPSGGAVPFMLELACRHTPHLDLIGPDIYSHNLRDFTALCETYRSFGNPLFIAEHSSSPTGRAERNVFYAIGDHGAIGFDPWAIDTPHLERDVLPFVDSSGHWASHAYWLRDSYHAIGSAMIPIVEAQGTHRIFTFAQEPAESGTRWQADGCIVQVIYRDPQGAGRGIIIQLGRDEFLAIGVGYEVNFLRPRPDGSRIPQRRVSLAATLVTSGIRLFRRNAPTHNFASPARCGSGWNSNAFANCSQRRRLTSSSRMSLGLVQYE